MTLCKEKKCINFIRFPSLPLPVNPACTEKQQGSPPVSKLLKMTKIPQWQILKLLGQEECERLIRSVLLYAESGGARDLLCPMGGMLDRWTYPLLSIAEREEDKSLATISHVGHKMPVTQNEPL